MRRLTGAQARRVAIAAQGLAGSRPKGKPNLGHLRRVVRSLHLVQIDSVNVVERAHHLTLFSRLGPGYDPQLLWRALEERRVFEFWARMASFVPIEDYPLYRHRMAQSAQAKGRWIRELNAKRPGYVESVYRQVVERGPLTVSELDEPGERKGPWWGWADGKVALEHLFAAGRVTVAYRRNFTRYYDLTERVIPAEHRSSAPDRPDAQRELVLRAAKALGVGTARDLADYYWLRVAEGKRAIAGLLADGHLVEVEVDGWTGPAYLHRDATVPRSVQARTLINPFDTYMWNRERVERLHRFEYKIEIYVPRPKRVYGYYVLPFLLGEDLVARVDVKADRQSGVLRVPGAYLEDGADPVPVARELAAELEEMAAWLGLGEIEVGIRGDLVGHLGRLL